MASVVVAHGLGCPAACGVFGDQGLSWYLLLWQVDSPLDHHGSVSSRSLLVYFCGCCLPFPRPFSHLILYLLRTFVEP